MRLKATTAMLVITPGELDALQMLSNGATMRAIADRIGVSDVTRSTTCAASATSTACSNSSAARGAWR
jgi:DNA-binding NarL/FixJ family response regulator